MISLKSRHQPDVGIFIFLPCRTVITAGRMLYIAIKTLRIVKMGWKEENNCLSLWTV